MYFIIHIFWLKYQYIWYTSEANLSRLFDREQHFWLKNVYWLDQLLPKYTHVLEIVVCMFVLFRLTIVLSGLLRFSDPDYLFDIFKLFFHNLWIHLMDLKLLNIY